MPLPLLVSMSQRPTWASRPAPPDLLWHLHPPGWSIWGSSGLVWASLLIRGISPEALKASNSRQAVVTSGACSLACMAADGCFRNRRAGKTQPAQLARRRLLGAWASCPGRGKATCMSGEAAASRGEYRLHTKGSRGSKRVKGPKPKRIKTRIWTHMQSAPQPKVCVQLVHC